MLERERRAPPCPPASAVRGGSRTPPPAAHAGTAGALSTGHANGPTPAGAHGIEQGGQMDAGGMTDDRAKSRLDQRLTVATGYVAIGLLALTLLVGPANLLFRRRNSVSSYLRRDAGMWTGASASSTSSSGCRYTAPVSFLASSPTSSRPTGARCSTASASGTGPGSSRS